MLLDMLRDRRSVDTLVEVIKALGREIYSVNEQVVDRLKTDGLLDYVGGKSTIFVGITYKNFKFIEALLKKGANPNSMISSTSNIPLIVAPLIARNPSTITFNYIELLVKYGADINIKYTAPALVDKTLLDMVDEAPLVEAEGPRQSLLPRANGPREGVDPRLRPFLIARGAKHASEMREEWIEQEMDRAREERRRANAEEVDQRANAAAAVRVAEAAEEADRALRDFGAALTRYCCDGILMPLIEILKDRTGKGLLYGFPITYTGFKVEGMDDAFVVYGKEHYSDQRVGTVRIVGGYAEPTDIVIQFKDPVDGMMKNFNYKTKAITGGHRRDHRRVHRRKTQRRQRKQQWRSSRK
jgi:hypothetical protein